MSEAVPIRKLPSVFDEIKAIQDRVTRRAYELFEHKGSVLGHDLEHWLQAEREVLWKPPLELAEKDGKFQLQAAIAGVEPRDIDIEVTPEDIVLKAETKHEHKEQEGAVHYCEFAGGKMFRLIHLPKKIDPDKVKAEFKNGLLRLTAPIVEGAQVRRVKPEAA
jgi:HSP20 family protein